MSGDSVPDVGLVWWLWYMMGGRFDVVNDGQALRRVKQWCFDYGELSMEDDFWAVIVVVGSLVERSVLDSGVGGSRQ
ncbi:hypothetical protein V6N11_068071 [Hibiscus sabdariffa]|uniref:Uncharacterized protein n=1 Tax=Hibiscus sabdariffa TaxID=183260 RepID=A0ABR2STJ5_9ROSI